MQFYAIELKTPPRFLFAVDAVVKNYQNRFHQRKNYLEIGLIDEGEIIKKQRNGTDTRSSPKSAYCITQDVFIDCRSDKKNIQRHFAVAVNAEYESELFDTENDLSAYPMLLEKIKCGCFLLPCDCSLEHYYEHVVKEIKQLIRSSKSDEPVKSGVEAIARWYSLVGILTQYVLKSFECFYVQPKQKRYAEQAMTYIRENIRSTLSLETIAAYLGISVGYLCAIFKKETGTTIVQYINEYRIKLIIRAVFQSKSSLKSIAEEVGFTDPLYASRIFKKITGFSFREYLSHSYVDDLAVFDNAKT